MELKYIGQGHGLGAIPLPEGWPAQDHDEPDEAVAKAKVESGHYRGEAKRPRNAEVLSEEE